VIYRLSRTIRTTPINADGVRYDEKVFAKDTVIVVVHQLFSDCLLRPASEINMFFSANWTDFYIAHGMLANIYRPADGLDCSLKGISSKFSECVLVGPEIPQEIHETADRPAFRVVSGHLPDPRAKFAVPVGLGHLKLSFGGNFAGSINPTLVGALPPYGIIPIHDRDYRKEGK
jgi:hypothetical protein